MIQVLPYTEAHEAELKKLIRLFRVETAKLKDRDVQPSEEDISQELSDYLKNGYSIFTARQDEQCAGFLVMRSLDGVWWVDTLYTLPEYRRIGIASALYSKAEEISQSSEADNLFVWVHPNNHRMLSFLKSRGYDVLNLIEVRKAWKHERLTRVYHFDESELRY